ncbi:hypothetical protein QAD02_023067 [Eretmocerus hayati]|uniref:Uncharacterized protein n=1 Tax=Eretmocerus hayati TaxID=131215 RepID=A0ACC2PVX5_9HYME|nr:hypothetical protein QAD02_023067 [Eretmocerus hayati]
MYSTLIFSYFSLLTFFYHPSDGKVQTLSDLLKLNRIIGGKNAFKGEFPHQVSLQWGIPPVVPTSHMCGGSIIGREWILTAAHCVTGLPSYGKFVVKAGKNFIKTKERTEQTSIVAKIYVHAQYQGNVSPFDIALLQLASPFELNEYVRSIKLPEANSIPVGGSTLSGWGSISKTSQIRVPNALQKVNLPLLDLNICRRAMTLKGDYTKIHETNICTGPLTGGLSACRGDSGGPLIAIDGDGDKEVIGVVSWGVIPCASVGAPAVYVRVSAFVDWINYIIQTYSTEDSYSILQR